MRTYHIKIEIENDDADEDVAEVLAELAGDCRSAGMAIDTKLTGGTGKVVGSAAVTKETDNE